MKVFLVHPPPYKSNRIMRLGRIQEDAIPNISVFFPIFLGYVAAILRESGHSVDILDATAEDLSLISIKKIVSEFNPDAVIVETVPITFKGDIRIANIAKQIDPKIHTIYYGLHATARPRDVLANQNIDFAVRGEPEYTSLELINALEDGGDLKGVKGLSFKENHTIKQNSARPFIENLDQLPYPARELFPIGKYIVEPFGKVTHVTASRGCPYSCIFCSSTLMEGNKLRSRDPKNIADEIESVVHRFNIRTIFFYACNFCLWNDKIITRFCKELLERKLDVKWLVNSRVDTLPSENTLKYMARSGCFAIYFGVESASLKMIRAMHKGRSREECETYIKTIEPAIEKTKRTNIFAHVQMLIGFSGENEETVNQSVDLVNKTSPDLPVNFGIVFPIPGTALGNTAEKEGLFPSDGTSNGKDWSWYDYIKIAAQLYAVTNNSTPDRIVKLRKRANAIVKFSLAHKLKLLWKLLRRRDFDIILGIIKLALKEGINIYKIRWADY